MKALQLQQKKSFNGFTLVEFIVIMAIFAVMVGVVLFNFTGFRSKITLDNLTQDISISIRQIQSSAGAALADPLTPTAEYARGIYFPMDGANYAKYFVLFEDVDGDGKYNLAADGAPIDTINIQTSDAITAVWYGDTIDRAENQLHAPLGITFKRFKTDAKFADDPSDLTAAAGVVRIQVTSADGKMANFITVSKLGQVSVQSVAIDANTGTPIIPTPGGLVQ